MKNSLKWVFISILVALAVGCAGHGSDPIASREYPLRENGKTDSGTQSTLWGLWNCEMDSVNGPINIVPIRSAMFTANV
ncbi:MAG: hypothetical protein ABIC40_08825, partial [bacterium]